MKLLIWRTVRLASRAGLPAVVFAVWLTVCLMSTSGSSSENAGSDKMPQRIAVVISMDLEPYQQAVAGFKEALAEAKVAVALSTYRLDQVAAQSSRARSEISSGSWDIVLSVGSEATTFVQGIGTKAPILFCVVSDPKGQGIVAEGYARGWAAGVTTDIPVSVQFQKLKEALPDAKRIGVVYDEKGSSELIKEAAVEAKAQGLELLAIPVKTQAEVPGAFAMLKNKVDVLWAIVDRTVYSSESARFILTFVLGNKLPFMAYSPQYVKAGALFGLSCDYTDLGRQAAEMAAHLLRTKTLPTPRVVHPRKYLLSINLRVMRVIGSQLPHHFLNAADTVFE